MTPDLYHKHLIFRIETLEPPKDVEFISTWMRSLIEKLGMELYAGPLVKYLDEEGNRGLTGVCIIKTSHIALHVWDEPRPGVMQLDVYTCGKMEVSDVVNELAVFNPIRIEYKFLDRDNFEEVLLDVNADRLKLVESGTIEYKS
jgi:S-adenosylmethionine/arginine decarboxylase-like enzyme